MLIHIVETTSYYWHRTMYFINWQRDVNIAKRNGQKVVVKSNKSSKSFHEYLLALSYTLVSVALGHPDSPPTVGEKVAKNESDNMRSHLEKLGIRTPRLISLSDSLLVEEFIEQGDLYSVFLDTSSKRVISSLANEAGMMTGSLHSDGSVFVDNKCQNYLVGKNYGMLYRTDLGFIQKKNSVFSRSMDIGTFLASALDLSPSRYTAIESGFHRGYCSVTNRGFPYLSIILRNILAPGFAFDHAYMLKNMFIDSADKCSVGN
jgi:tRNA A-37 threonylcarbamoyl transferase component Bud32